MGSSKTGSLDKFAAFSPAAALASGKVKLPETGIVGMLQAKQEDKMNQGAQMAQQEDDEAAQYMQMMQQQSGMNMGMNMGGRVGFSEGSGPDMDRVLELEEQGFSYEEAFEKAMQERLDRGYNQGGRVEMGFGGSSGVATPQAGTTPGSPESLAALGNSGNMGNMLKQLFQQNPELYQSMQQPGMAAGGPVESMQFLKQHLPYQDGGHVALRRKMFKMGGPVNTHGVGITSGLEFRNNYNAGGRVGMRFGGKAALDLLKKYKSKLFGAGDEAAELAAKRAAAEAFAGGIGETGSAAARAGIISKFLKPYREPINFLKGADIAADASKLSKAGSYAGRLFRAGSAPALLGLPLGAPSVIAERLGYDIDEEPTTGLGKTVQALRKAGEFGMDFSLPGFAYDAYDYLGKDLGDTSTQTLSGALAGRERDLGGDDETKRQISKTKMTVDELSALNKQENQERMQAAMEQYAQLLAGSDNTDKLGTLGDALIAGGSALMEGEGYGAAGRAFNEPLSGARRSKEERMQAANSAAAQLAVSENMQIDAEQRGIVNEFLKMGNFSDAEASQLYTLAVDAGVQSLVPEDDGELDGNTLANNPGVYADPKNLLGGGHVFVAVDSNGNVLPTNDPKEAKAHAAS